METSITQEDQEIPSTSLSCQETNQRKRKYSKTEKASHENWTQNFFFIKFNNTALCLICKRETRSFTKINVKRHYKLKHAETFDLYVGKPRLDKIQQLKEEVVKTSKKLNFNSNQELKEMKNCDEVTVFDENWEKKFFFAKLDNIAICLICGHNVNMTRFYKNTIKQHYMKKHADKFNEYSGKSRHDEIQQSKEELVEAKPSHSIPNQEKMKLIKKCHQQKRYFNKNWTEKFFFIQSNNAAVCLICKCRMVVFKRFNVQRHYMSKHAEMFDKFVGVSRHHKIQQLKETFVNRKIPFRFALTSDNGAINDNAFADEEKIAKATRIMSDIIATMSKPHIDGEYIKECVEACLNVFNWKCENTKWKEKFFFISHKYDMAVCLICEKEIPLSEMFNAKRHYMIQHAATFETSDGELLLNQIKHLMNGFNINNDLSGKQKCLKANFVVANIVGRRLGFHTDASCIKKCLESYVNVFGPEYKNVIANANISAVTLCRRIANISDFLENNLKGAAAHFKFFSLAVHVITDISNVTQLAVFIRGVDADFYVTEELASVVSLQKSSKSLDLYEAVKNTLQHFSLHLAKISGVATDCSPKMDTKKKKLMALIENDAITAGNLNLMKYHYAISHIFANVPQIDNVMKLVIKVVSFMKSNGRNHRRFEEFLGNVDVDFADMNHYNQVRLMTREIMLRSFYDLLDDIKLFMLSSGKSIVKLEDEEWHADLSFMVDMVSHFNKSNICRPVGNQIIHNLYQSMTGFEMKLKFLKSQMVSNNLNSFVTLLETVKNGPVNCKRYANFISIFITEFEKRFENFKENQQLFNLFANPFLFEVPEIPRIFQSECVELQSSAQLRKKYHQVPLLDFYKDHLPRVKYPLLYIHALFTLSLFSSTKIYDKLCSTKMLKNRNLSDKNLEHSLRIAINSHEVDIDVLFQTVLHEKLGLWTETRHYY